jgi:DNA helicase-2/ATP-dependent DNA helicase PcrA
MWQAANAMIASGEMTARAKNALAGFLKLVHEMAEAVKDLPLQEQVEHVIHQSGLIDHYGKEKSEKAEARVENLEELVSAAKGFEFHNEDDVEMDILTAFLTHAALEAGEGQADAWEDCVQLMTLHSAKGLEFPLVFMCGMEEGLFPHQRSVEEPGRVQEERRLCYVGITRARQKLYLSYAERRRLYGKDYYPMPSMFIGEIPAECVQDVRPKTTMNSMSYSRHEIDQNDSGFSVGQRVQHQKFGAGIVLNYEGQGSHARVEVNFDHAGSKWLVLSYANLQAI